MGILTDFIIADRSEAEAINNAEGRIGDQWPTLEAKRVDHVKLTHLWGLLTNAPEFDTKFLLRIESLHEQSEDGPWVFLVPQEFLDKLLAVPENQHQKLGEDWAKTEEFVADGWSEKDVQQYLNEFISLARRAKEAKKDLLFWMCL